MKPTPQHPPVEANTFDRLKLVPLKIKIVGVGVTTTLTVMGAWAKYQYDKPERTISVVAADGRPGGATSETEVSGNSAATKPHENETAGKATTESTAESMELTSITTTVPSVTPPRLTTASNTGASAWIESLQQECSLAVAAFAEADAIDDALTSLQEYGNITTAMATDLRSLTGAPASIRNAADRFGNAADGYAFAAELLVTNQRNDAQQAASQADSDLNSAMQTLARVGADACDA